LGLINERTAETLGNELVSMVESYNKWNLDHLYGYIFYNYARVNELNGKLEEIRPRLFMLYKLSSNSKNESSQAMLLNLILRNFIETKNFMSARDFLQNTFFPESKQNNEFIKYLFYTAHVKAVQQQALRKAPEKGVIGFKLHAQKLAIVCEMLIGDVPARTIFSHGPLKQYLFPYYELVHSLVKGDIVQFEVVKNKHQEAFKKDSMLTLINRLY
jgi:26S proteasome regulatory subunit N3